MNRRFSRPLLPILIGVLALALIAAVAVLFFRPGKALSQPADSPVSAPLSAGKLPKDTKLGIVVTLGSAQGSEWKDSAQGAAVATHRFSLGGSPVALETRDDRGTRDGARDAVRQLVEAGVAGIVLASDGEHIQGAFEAADEAGIPLLLPYYQGDLPDARNIWRLAPGGELVGQALTAALDDALNPLLIDLGGGTPAGITPAQTKTLQAGADPADLAQEIAKLAAPARKDPVDAVVLSGTATRQAMMVHALQQTDLPLPLVLTPQATSPAFVSALEGAGGSASSRLASVGPNSFDAAALQRNESGRSMSGYLTALRAMAADDQAKDLIADRAFAEVAAQADARSHDAVVALVRGVEAAGSAKPEAVAAKLGTLSLGSGDGIAAAPLNFGSPESLDGQLHVLHLTVQDLGLRPTRPSQTVPASWFAAAQEN